MQLLLDGHDGGIELHRSVVSRRERSVGHTRFSAENEGAVERFAIYAQTGTNETREGLVASSGAECRRTGKLLLLTAQQYRPTLIARRDKHIFLSAITTYHTYSLDHI